MAVALIPVTSSQIDAVGYDPGTRTLVVKFHAGGLGKQAVYSYADVPPELGNGLIAAASPGSYFHRHIRNGGYAYRRHQPGTPLPGEGVAPEARR
jgi:hypothetical protein